MSGTLSPWVYIAVAGFAATYVWRLLGVVGAMGLTADSPVLAYARAVATAIVAGLVAKIVIAPPGALAGVADLGRYGAVAAGVAAFYALRGSVVAGVVVAEAVLVGALLLS